MKVYKGFDPQSGYQIIGSSSTILDVDIPDCIYLESNTFEEEILVDGVLYPVQVLMPDLASLKYFQTVRHSAPTLVESSWVRNYEIVDRPQEEIKSIESLLREAIKVERDRRLEADFEFQGKMYQRDSKSLDRITGAATLAGFAIANGAQPGDLRWANPNRDFGWIASDNTVTPMDAQRCFTFGQAAAKIEADLIYASKTLREMNPIPENFTDDSYWNA